LLLLDINVGLLGMTRLWRLNWLLLIGLHLAILLWRVSRLRWIALLLRVTLLWLIALLRRTVFLLGLVRLWLTITLLRWIGNLLRLHTRILSLRRAHYNLAFGVFNGITTIGTKLSIGLQRAIANRTKLGTHCYLLTISTMQST
jgi:hypothetical protein